MGGDAYISDDTPPDLIFVFPTIISMDARNLGHFALGISSALTRVNELLIPEQQFAFRFQIVRGSMEARLFAVPKKDALQALREPNRDEMRRAPAKVAISLITAGALAGIAYLGSPWFTSSPKTDPAPARWEQTDHHRIGGYSVDGPPQTAEIGLLISHDPEFCRSVGKAFKAVWDDHAINTMNINTSSGMPPIILSRDEIASVYLECNSRRRASRGRRR